MVPRVAGKGLAKWGVLVGFPVLHLGRFTLQTAGSGLAQRPCPDCHSHLPM